MTHRRRSFSPTYAACLIAAAALAGCSGPVSPDYEPYDYPDEPSPQAACDAEASIAGDSPALMVTDPAALSGLPLEDVLSRLLERADDMQTTPLELTRRLFDTNRDASSAVFEDGIACDGWENLAHVNGPAAFCPRAEGDLAVSEGFFTEGHPDHFSPVAVVNRFDLTPANGFGCGEYRIVYAKDSGRTDPNDRVFLIFEMAMPNPNPGNLLGCRPLVEFWESLEHEPDPAAVGARLRSFFLSGIAPFGPPVTPTNLGLGSAGGFGGAGYYGNAGQLRVSQHMDEHWELRQFVADGSGVLRFVPTTVGNNPLPSRFGSAEEDPMALEFADDFAAANVESLAVSDPLRMSMTVRSFDLSGESALGGDAVNDYAARGASSEYLQAAIQARIDQLGLSSDCPPDDPLTPDSILRRATMDSCAGCHAPTQFLGEERKLGCGVTWPASLGEVHIDENGQRSDALKEVFLPRRAEVLTRYLRACNEQQVVDAFGASGGPTTKSASARRTIGGRSTH